MRGEIREFRDQNNRVLNAIREDLNAIREDLNATREDLGDLRSRVDSLEQKVDSGFIEMRGKFDATAAGLDQITGMLTTLLAQRGEDDR